MLFLQRKECHIVFSKYYHKKKKRKREIARRTKTKNKDKEIIIYLNHFD